MHVIIGDIHGSHKWKDIIRQHMDAESITFLGDYFDSFTHSALEQIDNFKEICNLAKENKNVTLLLGNHDCYIYPEFRQEYVSGYQILMAGSIRKVLIENMHLLRACHYIDRFLISHAGVSPVWVKNSCMARDIKEPKLTASSISDFVNLVWDHVPALFSFNGNESSGDDIQQTPFWIRPKSLMKAGYPYAEKGIVQIVGHTQQRLNFCENGMYCFMDSLEYDEYLIIEDNEPIRCSIS
jgi:hypothetical protein